MTSWVAVGLLGGVVGLDSTSFPQVMISRPLVAGALTGALFGRPAEGTLVGFIMEAYALIILPIGAARYPESGTATVAAAAAYMMAAGPGVEPGPLAIAILFGLLWEWLAGETVVLLRQTNGKMLAGHGAVSARQLERRHLAAMGIDFVRGGVMAAGGAAVCVAVLTAAAGHWGLSPRTTLAALAVLVATMVGTSIPLFGGVQSRTPALVAGLGVGLLLALLI